jgi:outer membrane protein assembly factor BamB
MILFKSQTKETNLRLHLPFFFDKLIVIMNKKNLPFVSILICLTVLPVSGRSQQPTWTHFRGDKLDGLSAATSVPVHWNDSTNILWKAAAEGKGWSSPVVYGNQIWITTAKPDGKEMKAQCLDLASGKVVFNVLLFNPDSVQKKHAINTYATPTCAIEKGFVYATFGTYGTACVNTTSGVVVWKRTDLNCDHVQGAGSSLLIYKNLLIVHCEGSDVQYIVALDKSNGKTVWRTDRPKELYDPLPWIGKKAYITPIIVNVNGKDLLISNGSAACIAYNPETGEEVWRIVQGIDSTISMPFTENGMVFFYTSYRHSPGGNDYCELLAVNPDGKGDIAATNILWRRKSPTLQLLTPLVLNGLIYTVDSENNLQCLDATTGEIQYTRKMKSKYHSSPVYAGGNIYFTSVKGETLVIRPGRELVIVAENKLPGEVFATPAFIDHSILLRTDRFLYRIQDNN